MKTSENQGRIAFSQEKRSRKDRIPYPYVISPSLASGHLAFLPDFKEVEVGFRERGRGPNFALLDGRGKSHPF